MQNNIDGFTSQAIIGFDGVFNYAHVHDENGQAYLAKSAPIDTEVNSSVALKYELDLYHHLKGELFLSPVCQQSNLDSIWTLFETRSGASLRSILNEPLSFEQKQAVASALINSLQMLHEQGVIHCYLCPDKLFVSEQKEGYSVTFLDLSSSVKVQARANLTKTKILSHQRYFSPEQTGKHNSSVDFRTDFYNLGLIFYELFLGRFPYSATSLRQLFHAHIAHEPEFDELCQSFPAICQIIRRLLDKDPDLRYHSTRALAADFQNACLAPTSTLSFESDNELGKLRPVNSLYGRENDVATLCTLAESTINGPFKVVLVDGISGVGKSSLVETLILPVSRHSGHFVTGKYDLLGSDVPMVAFIQAFQAIIDQINHDSEEEKKRWVEYLYEELGEYWVLLTNVLPDLARFFQQPSHIALKSDSTEYQYRFVEACKGFLRAACKSNALIVLFLDDVQWIDPLSINLLQGIEQDNAIENLLLVCAYRDNEMDALHPFYRFIDKMAVKNDLVNQVNLKPLKTHETCALLAYTLQVPEAELQDLAALIQARSLGNPFYIKQLLASMVDKGWLRFDGMQNNWLWDTEVIEQDQVGEDIVDLMINRLRQLSDGAQGLIRTAAAIGNRFEISMLKRIYEGETADFVVLFKEILNYDFVYSNHEAQQLLVDENVFIQYLSLVESVTFNFVHDRIQQAAYKLKDESMSEALHLTIALALAESVNDEQSDDLFQIVNHVNRAIALVPDEMKVRFAKLNLNAGLKAKKSAAYNAAKEYLSAADYLLGEQGWKEQNDLTYQVRFQYLQTLYLLTEFDQAQQAVERVLPYCNVITRRIPVYITHMLTLIGANRMKQAADLAVSVLEELGFELDVEPERNFPPVSNEDLEQHFLQMENLPEMIDESALNGIRVLMISGSSSFFSDHQTFMKISYTMFRLTVEYGNSPYSPYAYALYALVCNDLKMYRVGYRYCQLAMTLLKRDNNVELLPQVIEIFNVHMRHYCDPLVDCLPDIEQGAEIGRDIGGIEFASLNAVFYGPYALFAGLELTKVQSGLIKHHSLITRFGQKFCLTYQGIWQGLVSSLCLEHNGDMIASGEFDEELDVQIMEEESNHTCLSLFYLAKGILNTFLQDYAVASSYMWSARKLIHSVFGMRNSVEILFYHCLVNLKMATFSSDPEGYIQQSDYQNVFADFTLWSELCPQNNQAKYLILEAQFAASSGKLGRAMKLFHEASQKAKEYENWLDVSLAQLGLIEIQTQLTDETLAASFVANCLETLQGWGAHAIGANLILRYPLASRDSPIQVEYGVLVRTQDLHHLVYQKIEMESLVGTLQIIANETDQTELSRKILDVLVSSSNATSGAFFSIIEAESQPELLAIHRQKETHVVSSSDAFWGSTPILNKVISTGIPVVLSDALRDEKYSKDKHIHSDNVRSVLCAPMYRAKQIIGVIYLENNLLPNLFNAQQLEFIDLLIKQSVSALVNAQLYTLLKLEVEEKTAAESSLADLNKNLENKVEKRTIALKNANNELESSITRLKETQNKLVQSEKMASLGGLVAGVAHEINTPIGSALGASSFLVKRVEVIQDKYQNGTLTQKDFEALLTASAESMEIVNGNLLRAAELIRSFKRVAVDQSHEHIQHFDLIEVCRDVISSLRPKYKHLSLEFEWLGDPIVVVNHNPGVIGQIVTNLVMNSIHHGFDGAETGKITISTNLLDDKVTLGYRDNGKGMSEEVKSRIFEPFFTTTRGVGGSGLGMHIVFNLVTQKLNGEIQVVGSEESIGASFVISFPKSVID